MDQALSAVYIPGERSRIIPIDEKQKMAVDIGGWLHIKKYSLVSSAIERLKARMKTDRRLKRRLDGILEILRSKSQGQT